MAKNDWWFKFEIPAWRNSPELRKCSLETRGFWIDCIAIMRDVHNPTMEGTVQDIARMIGCFPDEVSRCVNELRRNNVADVTPVTILNGDVTVNVTLTSRRYKRELTTKEKSNLRVQKFRNKDNVTPKETPMERPKEKSNKKGVRKEREETLSPLSESAFSEYRKEVVEWYCSKLGIVSLPPRTDVSTDLRWLFTNNFTVSDLDAFYDFAKAETWRKGKINISAIAKGIGDWRSQQQSSQKKPAVSIPVNCTLGCNPDTGLREVVKDGQIAMVRCKHK